MSLFLFLVSTLRAVVEVAGLCLLAQGALYVLAGARREGNAIYGLFRLVAAPAVVLLGRLSGGRIPPRHRPWATFIILLVLWLGLAYLRQRLAAGGA